MGKATLTTQIIVAMVAGAVVGIAINAVWPNSEFVQAVVVDGLFGTIGTIFVSGLTMLVVPLVLVSLVTGVTTLGDVAALGRIGAKALLFYLGTTAVAITIALVLAAAVSPGSAIDLETDAAGFEAAEAPSLGTVIADLVPSNPVAAMADGNMLQIIVFAILFGVAVTLAGERARHVKDVFESLNAVIMHLVGIVMIIAPVGVFCLIARTFADQGLDVILPLAEYFFTVLAALAVHAFGTYGLVLSVLGRLNPLRFFSKMRAAAVFAFSTASSNATIPVTLRTVEERMGVGKGVASFTVPLGATINMDGTAIMQGVATVFIANAYGIDLGLGEFLTVILTATLASVGTAGVPGVGLIMLAMVLRQVGLPVEGIALIIGVDRLLDMTRTAVNITGDATVTTIIARSEKAFDRKVFDDPKAGVIEAGRA